MGNLKDNFLYDPSYNRFADFLGLDRYKRENHDIAKKVLFLYNWGARKADSGDYIDVLREVVSLKRGLGTTVRGETLVKDMYQWTRLDEESNNALKEQELRKNKIKAEVQENKAIKNRIIERARKVTREKNKLARDIKNTEEKVNKDARATQRALKKESRTQADADIKVIKTRNRVNKPEEVEV